jgi:hypothetical protein
MIDVKIEGLNETIKDLKDFTLNQADIYKVVSKASQGMVNTIKQNYIAAGHDKTGALVDSIEMFKRKEDGKFFSYYVGPRYTSSKGGLSGGGNAAHLLEYGTKMRYSANKNSGGAKIGGKVYGAKISRGQILPPTIGVIRKSYDEFKPKGEDVLMVGMNDLINKELLEKGFTI